MKKTFIYILKCPISYEVRYVGKTINLKRRFNDHICKLNPKYKSHVCAWIRKLAKDGLRPTIEVIEECYSNWADREIYWIGFYRNIGAKLCNITNGGEGMLGNIVSKETRQKISKNNARATEKTVYQFDLTGKFINKYKSVLEAAKKNNLNKYSISRICRGEYFIHGNSYWSYENKVVLKDGWVHPNARAIIQLDENGNITKEFKSITHAQKDTGIARQNINHVVSGAYGVKTAGGFYWKYKI